MRLRRCGMTAFAAACLIAVGATGAVRAQDTAPNSNAILDTYDEGGANPDFDAAENDGYHIVDDPLSVYTPEEHALVEEKFAASIAREIDPSVPFGFSFSKFDFDNDGFQDILIYMKMRLPESYKGFGVPVYVYMFDGKDWNLALKDQAMSVGVRLDKDGKGEIALVDDWPKGYRPFGLEGNRFVSQGPARVPAKQPKVAPLDFQPVVPGR